MAFLFAAALLLFSGPLLHSAASIPPKSLKLAGAASKYANEAAVIESFNVAFRFESDGTGSQDVRVRVNLQNEAGVREYSVIYNTYASSTESAQFVSVVDHHADGSTTVTLPSDAINQPAPATLEAPLYSDTEIQHLPVRGLQPGDTLDYEARVVQKAPEAPNQFWNSFRFIKNAVVLAETVTLNVPDGKYVRTWSPHYRPVVEKHNGRVTYRWAGSQLNPPPEDQSGGSTAADANPDIAWTTFRTWAEAGSWYRSLAAPQAAATPALQTLADQLTSSAKTPEDQVKAIYRFVSTHIRYIGIDFGKGRFQPHPAAVVLANGYGDCKDKDTLLEALLRAKGLTTAPALIGAGIRMISSLPTPEMFNHVITTVDLPSGRIWLDSTSGVAPFRLLDSSIEDKQALVIPSSGDAKLERTPAQPPFPFVDHFIATGTLTADGELDAHIQMEDRSETALALRYLARNLAPAQWDQAVQYLVRALGFSGSVSNSVFSSASDFSVPMKLTYDYKRAPYGDWGTLRITAPFPVLRLPAAPKKKPSDSLKLGSPRTEFAVAHIHLPAGFSAQLPDAVHVKTPFVTFDLAYSLEGGVLTARRTVVVLKNKLPPASWKSYQKFARDSSFNQFTFIQLTNTEASASVPNRPLLSEANPAAAEQVSKAVTPVGAQDSPGALKNPAEASQNSAALSTDASPLGKIYDVGGKIKPPASLGSLVAEIPENKPGAPVPSQCLVGLVVDSRGVPRQVHRIQCKGPDFGDVAVRTVTQDRFRPATLDGKPVAVRYQVPVGFTQVNPDELHPSRDTCTTTTTPPGYSGKVYKVGGGVTPPAIVLAPTPRYPAKERLMARKGTSTVSLIVNDHGMPKDVRIFKSSRPDFDNLALDAVRHYRFRPSTCNGKPVAVVVYIEVNFRIKKQWW